MAITFNASQSQCYYRDERSARSIFAVWGRLSSAWRAPFLRGLETKWCRRWCCPGTVGAFLLIVSVFCPVCSGLSCICIWLAVFWYDLHRRDLHRRRAVSQGVVIFFCSTRLRTVCDCKNEGAGNRNRSCAICDTFVTEALDRERANKGTNTFRAFASTKPLHSPLQFELNLTYDRATLCMKIFLFERSERFVFLLQVHCLPYVFCFAFESYFYRRCCGMVDSVCWAAV